MTNFPHALPRFLDQCPCNGGAREGESDVDRFMIPSAVQILLSRVCISNHSVPCFTKKTRPVLSPKAEASVSVCLPHQNGDIGLFFFWWRNVFISERVSVRVKYSPKCLTLIRSPHLDCFWHARRADSAYWTACLLC